ARVNPAANTATPELAFAIRLKVGSHAAGIFTPTNTRIVARTGAHTTGSFAAEINALRLLFFLPSAPEEGFSKYRPIGIVIALTIIEIIATTKPVDTESPLIGSRTANPRNPMVGEPAINAHTAASAWVSLKNL